MHTAHSKVGLAHLVGQPVYLAPRVTEDDCLRNRKGVVEIAKGVKFPVFFLYSNEILLQAFEGQLVTLDKDTNRIGHELSCHVQDIVGQSSRDYNDLGCGGQISIDVVDLLSETLIEQLVCFVEDKHLNLTGTQVTAANHIGHTAWGSGHNVLAIIKLSNILSDVGAANASMALNIHVIAEGHDNRLDLGGQFAGWGEHKGLGLANGSIDDL